MCFFVQGYSSIEGRTAYITDVLTSVFNALFAITAILVNSFVIYVIRRSAYLKNSPANILVCYLAVSDLVIGLICQTSFVLYKVSEVLKLKGLLCSFRLIVSCFGWICAGVSLLTISSIIVDQYLALRFHLRYNTIVTANRVYRLVFLIWTFCTFMVSLRFFFQSDTQWTLIPLVLLIIALFLTTICYVNIFCIVKQHHTQIMDQQNAIAYHNNLTDNARRLKNNFYTSRYKKTAATMLYVLLVFLICYVPMLCTMLADASVGYVTKVKITYDYASTIVFMSSSINPVLYCLRIREIRSAIINTILVLTKWDFRRGPNVNEQLASENNYRPTIKVKQCNSLENVYD